MICFLGKNKNRLRAFVSSWCILGPAEAQTAPELTFTVPPGFSVERAMPASHNIINMTFHADGRIFLSLEKGPILLAADNDKDGSFETVTTFTDRVTYSMGLLWLEPPVVPEPTLFAVGNGPGPDGKNGDGIFRVIDADKDGKADKIERFAEVQGMGEHGTHGIVLGPDRHLYVVAGNHSRVNVPYAADSPLLRGSEGTILPPYYDPNGHAVHCRFPGGTVVRTDLEGKRWTYFSAGFRNAYDIAFTAAGDLFTFDSDMEWDTGTPWYRPIRFVHCVPGGDYGWRTSSYNGKPWQLDSLPPAADAGRGSPTGVTTGERAAFPEKYRNSVLGADWSQARIVALPLKKEGATYTGTPEDFVVGKPQMNVSDLEVGPDGALYFVTGGRGVIGTLYRVVHRGSANSQKVGAASSSAKASEDKREPPLPSDAATNLSHAAKSLGDKDPFARRRACEAIAALRPEKAPREKLYALLGDGDRWIRYAAREALERTRKDFAVEPLRDAILKETDPRRAVEGLLLLARTGLKEAAPQNTPWTPPAAETGEPALYEKAAALLDKGLPPDLLPDLLRTLQLAIHLRGDAPEPLRERLAAAVLKQFPAKDDRVNRESAVLLARWAPPGSIGALLTALEEKKTSQEEQIHLAYCLRAVETGWTTELKKRFLGWFERSRGWTGGNSFRGYLDAMLATFQGRATSEEIVEMVKTGSVGPAVAAELISRMDAKTAAGLIEPLKTRYAQITDGENPDEAQRYRESILLALARTKHASLEGWFREIYTGNPRLREVAVFGLAQYRNPDDWPHFVEGLRFKRRRAADECAEALKKLGRPPKEGAAYRTVLDIAKEHDPWRARPALEILSKWTGRPVGDLNPAEYEKTLADWEEWLAKTYPEFARKPSGGTDRPVWTFEPIRDYLARTAGRPGSPARGAAVFKAARCIECHGVVAGGGGGIGPDLTGLFKRFSEAQVLESVYFPSRVVSDQYQGLLVQNQDGRVWSGRVVEDAPAHIVLLPADGQKMKIERDEIFLTKPMDRSLMPEGLLAAFTLEDIKDLFAYLAADGVVGATLRVAPAGPADTGRVTDSPLPDSAWEPLFANGLDGWDNTEGWTVENGVLVGKAVDRAKSSYLVSKASWGDFELAFDVKLTDLGGGKHGPNSGVQYRSAIDPAKIDPVGYQADIGGEWWGSIFVTDERFGALAKAKPEVVKPAVREGEWNHYVVRADGDRHRIEINGVTTVEAVDDKHPNGVLAFQLHAWARMEVRYANVRIRRLRP